MAEELLEFENTIEDEEGRSWVARVLGAERKDGRWVGWIRFRQATGETLLDTDRETTQPNRDDLVYWARGLTYFYLEGALARARRRSEGGRAPASTEPVEQSPLPSAGSLPRLEVVDAPPRVIQEITGSADPRPGTLREVPDAGVIVYEGRSGDRPGMAHYFALRFGSRNSGAVLANWLWSRLKGSGATVRVNGEPVELTQTGLADAIVGP